MTRPRGHGKGADGGIRVGAGGVADQEARGHPDVHGRQVTAQQV
ncbi:hypothetical protein [Streptomyces incarnatus]|nr:hypothetical protein [Streptomyces incarnatus]